MQGQAGLNEVITGAPAVWDRSILTMEALALVGDLVGAFRERIADLVVQRRARQRRADAGERFGLLDSTAWIRESEWQCAPVPADLFEHHVEMSGPPDRQTLVKAANARCSVFVANFDRPAATWSALLEWQQNLRDAVRGDLGNGPLGAPAARWATTLMVRPRGLQAIDAHLLVNRRPAPAALVDAGLFLVHNAHALVARGSAPYFLLSNVQSYQEARLWNDVFLFAERALGLHVGTIRAAVQIDTPSAAIQMDEILHALRRHSAGLWGGFVDGASELLIGTCRRRGVPGRTDLRVDRAAASAGLRVPSAAAGDRLRQVGASAWAATNQSLESRA